MIVAPGGIPFGGPAEPAGVVWSQACLRVLGVRVDPKTGHETSIESTAVFDPGLRCVQRSQEQLERDRTAVLAVIDGADVETVTRLRREHGLAFATIPDPEGVIGRLYGVACWPTMVSIDPDRRVATTRMGGDPGALAAWERAS